MATFVLAHRAWHGVSCWKEGTLLLRAAENEVNTPTLTSLGERVQLASPRLTGRPTSTMT